MKMNRKLILLFSLMALFTTAANMMYFLHLEMAALESSTSDNLTAVGEKMIDEIEQYVKMMDYVIDGMISDAQFMQSMRQLDQLGGDADVVSAQTMVSQALFHNPINLQFYRVSLFNREGLFISSQFEKTGTVESLSDEARDLVAGLPYLARAEEDLSNSHLIPPHRDPWNFATDVEVFSAVRAAVWHGKIIGYLEVAARAGKLADIFSVSSIGGLTVQAVFDGGEILYNARADEADYSLARGEGMRAYRTPSGEDLMVVALYSRPLGLNVYIAQSVAVHNRSVSEMILRYISAAGVILAAAVLLITLFSFRLTNSIRRLTKKVRALSVNDVLHASAAAKTVTAAGDVEIRELESVFDGLTRRLQVSLNNEIAMREASLHAQLGALQAQINPHFIYNTLNIISAKAMESGNEEIIDICDQFAQMLRYSTSLQTAAATLSEELNHVRSYLHLAKARYEERLSYEIDVPARAGALSIPKLILQPLVENAIKHGYGDENPKIHIAIRAEFVPGGLLLTIRDDGQGFPPQALKTLKSAFSQIRCRATYDQDAAAGHIGLANTYMRLYYYSGGRIPMELYNDRGAVIKLTIPAQMEESK